jgi:transcriptional regulator with AAA-type ATPase domain
MEAIVKSESMVAVFEALARAVHAGRPALLLGEPGVGKETMARAVHAASHLREGPFEEANIASFPEALLPTAVFGSREEPGVFARAAGGVAYVSEIDDAPPRCTRTLANAIVERTYSPSGETTLRPLEARVIACSTSLRPGSEGPPSIWLRVFPDVIVVPPLRERPSEIAPLARGFLDELERVGWPASRISDDALAILERYSWPGNVRSLRVVIQHAALFAKGADITPDLLPDHIASQVT